ncbi:hypothetical protein L1887_51391 [Cichorium endivia]|nr:hypothetical protein L1887_51391 [Cichorium endivia]
MVVTGDGELGFDSGEGALRNGYHIQGRQQARKLPNPDTGRCAPVYSSLLSAMRSWPYWPGRASGAVTLKKLECSKQAYALLLTSYVEVSLHGQLLRGTMAFQATEIIAIVGLQRGIPSKRESSARVDYVPALCTHRPSLLPIEWSGEVLGSRRRGRFAAATSREFH